MDRERADVVIVRAGPAGLFAARELVIRSELQVVVLERGPDLPERLADPSWRTSGFGAAGSGRTGSTPRPDVSARRLPEPRGHRGPGREPGRGDGTAHHALYESKLLHRSKTFNDRARTFCVCPYGEVTLETYEDVVTVNGHSYAGRRTANTNFAVLVTTRFTEPFHEPIAYGRYVAHLANLVGGTVIIQRLGDLRLGRRSTPERHGRARSRALLARHAALRRGGQVLLGPAPPLVRDGDGDPRPVRRGGRCRDLAGLVQAAASGVAAARAIARRSRTRAA